MSWENTRYIVENYNKIVDEYFSRMETEKALVETYNIPKATKKKTFQGFSLDTLFLNMKEYTFYSNHIQYTTYYWHDYYFLEPRIVELTPEQYLEYTYIIEDKEYTNIHDILERPEILSDIIEDYRSKISRDEKQQLPYIDFIEKIFDGRHRVLGAYSAGLDKIPCMIFI